MRPAKFDLICCSDSDPDPSDSVVMVSAPLCTNANRANNCCNRISCRSAYGSAAKSASSPPLPSSPSCPVPLRLASFDPTSLLIADTDGGSNILPFSLASINFCFKSLEVLALLSSPLMAVAPRTSPSTSPNPLSSSPLAPSSNFNKPISLLQSSNLANRASSSVGGGAASTPDITSSTNDRPTREKSCVASSAFAFFSNFSN